MMSRYHINAKGVSAICKAEKGQCPFGEENHFATQEEADVAAKAQNTKKHGIMPSVNTAADDAVTQAQIAAEEYMYATDVEKLGYGDEWEGVESPGASDYAYPVMSALRIVDGKPKVDMRSIDYDYVGEVELNIRDTDYYSEPSGDLHDTTAAEDENLERVALALEEFVEDYNRDHPDQDYGEEHGKGLEGLVSSIRWM